MIISLFSNVNNNGYVGTYDPKTNAVQHSILVNSKASNQEYVGDSSSTNNGNSDSSNGNSGSSDSSTAEFSKSGFGATINTVTSDLFGINSGTAVDEP